MVGPGRRTIPALSLAALVVIFGSGGAKAGIVITMTTVQETGDPQVQFDFQIALPPGTSITNGDSITIDDVPDVNSTILPYVLPSNLSGLFTVTTSPGTGSTTDVTMTLNPPYDVTINNPSGAMSDSTIGNLYVTTTDAYPPAPDSPLLQTLTYTSTVAGVQVTGYTTPQVVPEPNPLVLAMVGAGLGLPWVLRKRRPAATRA